MKLRAYAPERDQQALLQLRRAVWGDAHRHSDTEFFDWMFKQNPDGAGGGVLIDEQGAALGFAGLMTRQLAFAGQRLAVAFGMDYMMHPEYRNGYAASRLANFWTGNLQGSDYAFGLCFPNQNSYRILTGKKLGWQPVCALTMYARPLGAVTALPGKLAALPRWLLAPAFTLAAAACDLIAALRDRAKTAGAVQELTQFDQRFDQLWQCAQIAIGGIRNAAYLRWRYETHPLYRYRIFAWVDGEQLLGYLVVTQREEFGIPAMLVVDALAAAEAPHVIAALIAAVAQIARREGDRMLCSQALAGSTFARQLQRGGLLPVPARIAPKTFTLTAHALGGTLPALDPADWHLTWGDMDVI